MSTNESADKNNSKQYEESKIGQVGSGAYIETKNITIAEKIDTLNNFLGEEPLKLERIMVGMEKKHAMLKSWEDICSGEDQARFASNLNLLRENKILFIS